MAPRDCFTNDMDWIDGIETYEQEPEYADEGYQQAVSEWLRYLKHNIQHDQHRLQQFKLRLSQNQRQGEFKQHALEQIQEELQQLRIRQQNQHEVMKLHQIKEEQDAQEVREIRQLNNERKLIGIQIRVLQLQQELHKMQQQQQDRIGQFTQQQMDHQLFPDQLIQQMYMHRLDQGLQHLQLDLQIKLLQPRINKLYKQPEISQQTQLLLHQHIEEELHEVKHQLNILLVNLQQVQLEQLLQQVQYELNKQKQYPQQNDKHLQRVQQHIDQIKQLKQQPMPGKQQLLFLAIVLLRQLILQHQLNKIKFQLQLIEFEQQLQLVGEQIDYLEEQLQELQPEDQLYEQLESVKQKFNYMQDYTLLLIVELEQIRESLQQRLERPRTTREKIFKKGLEKIESQYEKLRFQGKIHNSQSYFQEGFCDQLNQLKEVQNVIGQLQQQIEEEEQQHHLELLLQV